MVEPSPPEKVGPYRLIERLGAGGMGVVYRGRDERLDRSVALKHIGSVELQSELARRRFRREARAIARVSHPAVVRIHDWVESDTDGDWFVMELVTGQTLKRFMEVQGPLDASLAARLGAAIAGGLAAAHRQGIIHRDLKPENVMITADLHPKILDFGLVKWRIGDPEELDLTGDGKLVGTVSAMAPEQALGLDVDARTDLFALGVLLYEMVAGQSPFRAGTSVQTLARICNFDPLRLDERLVEQPDGRPETLPAGFSDLVAELMAKDPAARPSDAAEVESRLGALSGFGTSWSPPTSQEPTATVDLTEELPQPWRPNSGFRDSSSSGRRSVERIRVSTVVADLAVGDGQADLLFEALADFQALGDEVAARFGAFVESGQGHRLVLCCGYPEPKTDDTERAVATALALAGAQSRLQAETGLYELELRVAVHSGIAALLDDGARSTLVLGPTLDVAVAAAGLASPGEALVTPEVRRSVASDYAWAPGPELVTRETTRQLARPS